VQVAGLVIDNENLGHIGSPEQGLDAMWTQSYHAAIQFSNYAYYGISILRQ
jgi:hypothetical protein